MILTISIIVPAYNAASTLRRCLDALKQESDQSTQIIVVDDGSTDHTAQIARDYEFQLIQTPRSQSGPAAARNLGCESTTGEILFFIDADVVIQRGSIALVRKIFSEHPNVAAVFGSYDDAPAEKNFLSQYKNLLHHFVHQNSEMDAQTFWAGCGAVRKSVFVSVGRFNEQNYSHPSIEDIELGIRMKLAGHSIRLEKALQGKHLKRWTPASLLKADILHRAYPWSRLIMRMGEIPNQLNLQMSHRISSVLVFLFFAALIASIVLQSLSVAAVVVCLSLIFIVLNRGLYGFLISKRGLLFTAGAVFWHMLYYMYSAIIFVYCWVRFGTFRSARMKAFRTTQINVVPDEKR